MLRQIKLNMIKYKARSNMTKALTEEELVKLIFSTNALSVWDNKTGPIFWYAAGFPGPFYVNTEKVVGADVAERLLESISTIVKLNKSAADKSSLLYDAVMTEYKNSESFQQVVASLKQLCEQEFNNADYTSIAGGERRDWFFSIPLAEELGKEHLYIFKNKDVYKKSGILKDEKVIHVADLINNAASHFDSWIPTLEQNGVKMVGALSVIHRGSNGMNRLKEINMKTHTLKGIDYDFFIDLENKGLIKKSTLEELKLFFEDKIAWGRKYIISNSDLFDLQALDSKSLERAKSFIANDPWDIEKDAKDTFAKLKETIG